LCCATRSTRMLHPTTCPKCGLGHTFHLSIARPNSTTSTNNNMYNHPPPTTISCFHPSPPHPPTSHPRPPSPRSHPPAPPCSFSSATLPAGLRETSDSPVVTAVHISVADEEQKVSPERSRRLLSHLPARLHSSEPDLAAMMRREEAREDSALSPKHGKSPRTRRRGRDVSPASSRKSDSVSGEKWEKDSEEGKRNSTDGAGPFGSNVFRAGSDASAFSDDASVQSSADGASAATVAGSATPDMDSIPHAHSSDTPDLLDYDESSRGRARDRVGGTTARSSRAVSVERARSLSPTDRQATTTLAAQDQDLRWFEDRMHSAVVDMVARIQEEIDMASADTETLRVLQQRPDGDDDEPGVERPSAVVNDQVNRCARLALVVALLLAVPSCAALMSVAGADLRRGQVPLITHFSPPISHHHHHHCRNTTTTTRSSTLGWRYFSAPGARLASEPATSKTLQSHSHGCFSTHHQHVLPSPSTESWSQSICLRGWSSAASECFTAACCQTIACG
jgi:hypothetical protein